ncbi:MAG: hypothetical protein HKN58_07195, partial [Xanthomonadales bacterium]|nr:hypothetical protein [Xanthomonadales bacterium]
MLINYGDLWLAILVGAVLCWVASAVIHMVIKYHDKDYKGLANEDEVRAAIRNGSPESYFYNIPYCADMKEFGSEEMQAKMNEGPVGFLTVLPNGMPNMGKLMGQQFAHFLITCALVAYVAALGLPPGADYMTVFRFVMTTAFLAFGLANIPYSIWYGQPWGTTLRFMLDALIYGAVVAGVFG